MAIKNNCHEFLDSFSSDEKLSEKVTNLKEAPDFLFNAIEHDAETVQALLKFKKLPVNSFKEPNKQFVIIIALLELCMIEFQMNNYLRKIAIAKLLLQDPRIRLDLKDSNGKDGMFYLCDGLGYFRDKLLSNTKFPMGTIDRLLRECDWLDRYTVLKNLLPAIPLYSNPALLSYLFQNDILDPDTKQRLILLKRPDLLPLENLTILKLNNLFGHTNNINVLRLTIIHPGSDMTYFLNKKIINKEIFIIQRQAYYKVLCSRRSIALAEKDFKSGKLDEAAKNLIEARRCDSTLVDLYVQQILITFPEKYDFTPAQHAQLFTLPSILQSNNLSILILLARESKQDARTTLLEIAKIKATEKVKLIYDSPHKLFANKVIEILRFGYEKQIERDHILSLGVELIIQGVSLHDTFFKALLSFVDDSRMVSPTLTSLQTLKLSI